MILPIIQFNLVVISFKIFTDKLPATLKTYMMVTSTEMMKDRKVIEEVVQEQKRQKNERNYRVFQAMRLIRREYMKMLIVDNLSEDCGSEYGDEFAAKTIMTESCVSDL